MIHTADSRYNLPEGMNYSKTRCTGVKKKSKLIVLSLIVVLGVAAYAGYQRMRYRSMIICTIEWARLAPFPESTQSFKITSEGSMFTRSFRVQFTATPEAIQRWIGDSPGMQGVEPSVPRPNVRNFNIRPGGGAQHAEVEIDDATDVVCVYVYWS